MQLFSADATISLKKGFFLTRNQPKSQFIFHKNGSLCNFYIMTLPINVEFLPIIHYFLIFHCHFTSFNVRIKISGDTTVVPNSRVSTVSVALMMRSVRSLRLLGPSFHSVNSLLMIVLRLLRLLREEVFLVSLVMRRLQRVPIGIIVLIIDFLILEKIFFVGAFVLLIVLQIEETRLNTIYQSQVLTYVTNSKINFLPKGHST